MQKRCTKNAFFLVTMMLLNQALVYAQADTVSGPWGLIRMNDNTAYVLSNTYRIHDSTYVKAFLDKNNINDWGGSITFTGIPEEGQWWGAGVGQLITGVWPWPGTGNTTNSGMPFQICGGRNYVTEWAFEFTDTNTLHSWAFYYELWVHKSENISGNNISADIMIQPDYDENKGSFQGSLVDNLGFKWNCYVNFTSRYEIIHFNREEKTQELKDLDLKPFWDFCVDKGWAKATDYISCITAGLEAFSSGSAAFKTTSWALVSDGVDEPCAGVGTEDVYPSFTKIYPNPASQMLNINSPEQGAFSIFNEVGILEMSGQLNPGHTHIDISILDPGLYIIETDSGSESSISKITIQ